jgi:hypothetical protein
MEKKIGSYLIEIEQDMNPESPREKDYWDNFGTMVCFHNRYSLGDEHDYNSDDYSGWDEQLKVISKNEDVCVILPLYLYDHSGITMNTTGFSCRWDSGQVGWIFISKEKVRKEYSVKRISKKLKERITGYLINEVKTYDQYLTGEVYGYKISKITKCDLGHEDTEELDSCWGYYGENSCLEEAEKIVEFYQQPKQLELELV